MSKLNKIKQVLSQRKYQYVFLASALGYFLIYNLILKYVALLDLFSFFKTFSLSYAIPSFGLAIGIAALMGVNFALLADRYATIKLANALKGSSTTSLGVFAALLATGCPSCGIGVLPTVASVFGISASLGSLPFGGIELQLLSVGLLILSIFFLAKGNKVCEPELPGEKK